MEPPSSFTWNRALALALACSWSVAPGCAGKDAAAQLVVVVPGEDRDAQLYVDGHYVGQVGAVSRPEDQVRLAPGTHRVEVRKPGRFPVQRTVTVRRHPPPQVVVEAELLEDPP